MSTDDCSDGAKSNVRLRWLRHGCLLRKLGEKLSKKALLSPKTFFLLAQLRSEHRDAREGRETDRLQSLEDARVA